MYSPWVIIPLALFFFVRADDELLHNEEKSEGGECV